jgi:predicted enzyme related to lactoylglutathione lyase
MGERSQYAPGTPCWIDIGTDVEAAKAFYGGLFGWTAAEAGPAEETGGYGFFLKDGKSVAGFGPQQNPGPPVWTTYISVTDADAIVPKVEDAGGKTVMPPMDVMTAGRFAVFQDHQGAFFSVWQPGDVAGAELVNDPGCWSWNELNTRDVEGSKQFYSAVFGLEPVTHGEGPGAYTELQLGGESVAGMIAMQPMIPAQVPPHWLVYFSVTDTDASVARVTELGGSLVFGPVDVEPGRLAVVADPQGATFAVIRLSEPAS